MFSLAVLLALAGLTLAEPAKAQDLVILRSQLTADGVGKDMSEEMAEMLRSRIPIPVEIENVPPARIGEAMSRPGRAVCALMAKANVDRLSLVPVQEVARYEIVVAEFNQSEANRPTTIGGLNFFINQQAALANGLTLHTVPSITSAIGMIRAGRLTHFLGADGAVRVMARANDLTILSLRKILSVSMWAACSQASTARHRAVYVEAWDALLRSGELDDFLARHEATGLLQRSAKPESP